MKNCFICVVGIRCSLSPFLFFDIFENSYNKGFKGTEVFKEEAGGSRLSFSTQVNDYFPESSFPEKGRVPYKHLNKDGGSPSGRSRTI